MDDYRNRSYGEIPVGFGEKPGIVVVDFQTAFTDVLLGAHRWSCGPCEASGGGSALQRARRELQHRLHERA